MVKSPKIRHSKSRREPLTIELGPDEVSRIERQEAPAESTEDMMAGETEGGVSDATADAETSAEAAAEPGAAAVAESENAGKPAEPDKPGDDDAINLMGSEWPPEPGNAALEGERMRFAFGRDPGTPPPGGARTATGPANPIPQPAPSERRNMPFVAAGLVGGVIALLGAGGLQWAGLLGSGGKSAGNGEAVAALKAEIDALKQQVDAVKSAPGGDTAALSQSVTDLQGGVQGLTAALDQAKTDIAALKDAVSQGAAGDGAAVQALNQKLTELEASVATLKDAAGQGSNDAVQALDQKIAALQAAVAALQQGGASQQAIDAINQKLGAVETAVATASEAAKAGDARIAALEQSVASLSDQVAGQAAQPKVALAIAAAALKSAIERGGTFTGEVETFAAIAPNSPELPALREIAAKGVASRAELAEGMEEAANAMIAAGETLPDDAGFWDKLWASAESMVKVRPIGAVEGETVPAKVARMEVAVKAGDFAKAVAEYDTLPEASRAAGQAFADRIKARIAAEELVAKALAGALQPA